MDQSLQLTAIPEEVQTLPGDAAILASASMPRLGQYATAQGEWHRIRGASGRLAAGGQRAGNRILRDPPQSLTRLHRCYAGGVR